MFEAEVARGAAWLDEHKPGWERLIDVGKLDLAGCQVCVLGQVFADKVGEVIRLGNAELTVESGFAFAIWSNGLVAHSVSFGFAADESDYPALTDTWGRLLKERFDTGALSDAGL